MRKKSVSPRERQDWVRTPAALWMWCLPIGLVIFATSVWNGHQLPGLLSGGILTSAIAWMGTACYLNGRRCGRTHCKIDGILLPLLALVGSLNLLGAISFDWNGYAGAFWIIVLLSFVPEFFGLAYLPQEGEM